LALTQPAPAVVRVRSSRQVRTDIDLAAACSTVAAVYVKVIVWPEGRVRDVRDAGRERAGAVGGVTLIEGPHRLRSGVPAAVDFSVVVQVAAPRCRWRCGMPESQEPPLTAP